MTLKSSLFVIILILTFVSCSNESTDNNDSPQENPLLLRERITDYDGDILTEYFSYDGNNNLTSILDSDGFEYEYIYENDLLKRINYTSSNGSLIDYTILEYDSSNRLSSYNVYITSGNEGLRFDLTYNADSTITEKEYSGDHNTQTSLISENILTLSNGQIISETDSDFESNYEYDTKNGIYKNISIIETLNLINIDFSGYIDSAENNIIKVTENDNGTESVFEEYEYTYNTSNFPESALYYYEGVLDSTIQYFYE